MGRSPFGAVLALGLLAGLGCDDPVRGPIGGLIVAIRQIPAIANSPFADVERLELTYTRVEAVHRKAIDSNEETKVVLDTQERTIVLVNAAEQSDVFVAQFQVPVGFVTQVRFFPKLVTIHLKDGAVVELVPTGADLPSWRNTGWKIEPAAGEAIPIEQDELIGLRGEMNFADRLVNTARNSWKVKPTLPAVVFEVNPPEGAPGVFADQLTVVFKPGTTRAQIDAINAEIGASVRMTVPGNPWYRIKLPASTNLELAAKFYDAQEEVQNLLPATNFAEFTLSPNDDANPEAYDLNRIRDAWEHLQANGKLIGSHRVRVAVLESSGIDIVHRDLYRNIAINQGELPPVLFDSDVDGQISGAEIATFDFDPPGAPDGIISFRDLEHIGAEGIRPVDVNSNGYPDAEDLVNDTRWANGDNEDNNGVSSDRPKGFVDDLVGWNFSNDSNFPTYATRRDCAPGDEPGERICIEEPTTHGTAVSGLIGAEGNNAYAMAGVNWRISIVPVRTAAFPDLPANDETFEYGTPDVMFAAAVRYVEELGVDIANISQGWQFVRKGMPTDCSAEREFDAQSTRDIKGEAFEIGLDESNRAWGTLFSGTKVLWVFASGNSGWNIGDERALVVPAEPVRTSHPDHSIIAGSARTENQRWHIERADGLIVGGSNYGESVDIFAGIGLRSLHPTSASGLDGEVYASTSFAAPLVTGVLALHAASHLDLRKQDGRVDVPALKDALTRTARNSVNQACGGDDGERQLLLDARALLEQP